MRLLLFSNSTNVGEDYLNFPLPYIDKFLLPSERYALFIPFAGISIGEEDYFQTVSQKLERIGINLISLHHATNVSEALINAHTIIIGGGNTFVLLKKLQELKLLSIIREKIMKGIPYIGWSAGSNLACPTIKTTNDMPIVQPADFNSLDLVPFQINPHYTDLTIKGHGGETREMRINEFLIANKQTWVIGLREGTLLEVNNSNITLKGESSCRIFKYGNNPYEISPFEDLNFILQ